MKNIRKCFLGFYRECDILTMFSIAMAFLGIILAMKYHYTLSILCMVICGICDAFDGKLSRKHKYSEEQKLYGVQLDSLSDSFCFGAFPALLTCLLSPVLITYVVSILYLLCGIIRLAYFNMRIAINSDNSKEFIGVPITTVSIVYPAFFLILRTINYNLIRIIMPIVLVIQGLLFIVTIRIKKRDFTIFISTLFSSYTIQYIVFPLLLIVISNYYFFLSVNKTNAFIMSLNVFKNHFFPTIVNVLWLSLFCLFANNLFGNTKRGKKFVLIVIFLILCINDVKLCIMDKPLVISDINYLNPDNTKMMGEATTTIGPWVWKIVVKSIVYFCLCILIIKLDKKFSISYNFAFKRICLVVFSFLLFILPLLEINFISSIITNKVYKVTQEEIASYSYSIDFFTDYGLFSGMILNNSLTESFYKPQNYNLSETLKVLENAESCVDSAYGKANVVFLLSESLTDMDKVSDVQFDRELLSFINSLSDIDNAFRGELLVTTYGGASVNTEFQILTGASLYFWDSSYVPFNQYYNHYNITKAPNIITEFNNNGYTTMYLTPWGKNSYHSEYIYSGFGTDELIYNLKGEKKGKWYSDEALVNEIYKELSDTRSGNYKFIMAASAENHFPYLENKFTDYDIEVIYSPYGEEDTNMLLSYAQGVFDADKSFELLYNKIQTLDVPTIVILFGDHFPYIINSAGESVYLKSPYFNTQNEDLLSIKTHITPLAIISNYDINFHDLQGLISASYIGAYFVNKLDLELSSSYFNYIDSMRCEIPVFDRKLYLNTDSGEFELINDNKTISSNIDKYRNVQYYKFYELGL